MQDSLQERIEIAKQRIAEKEQYYQKLEALCHPSDEELKISSFLHVLERTINAEYLKKSGSTFEEYRFETYLETQTESQRRIIESLIPQIQDFSVEDLFFALELCRMSIFSGLFMQPFCRAKELFVESHLKQQPILDSFILIDSLFQFDHEVDKLVVEELIEESAEKFEGWTDSDKDIYVEMISKFYLLQNETMQSVFSVQNGLGRGKSLIEILINGGKHLSKAPKYIFYDIVYSLECKGMSYGEKCSTKEYNIFSQLLAHPYLLFLNEWLFNPTIQQEAKIFFVQRLGEFATSFYMEEVKITENYQAVDEFEDPEKLFVIKINRRLLNLQKLIKWIKEEFITSASNKWEWFGLVYLLAQYKCFNNAKAEVVIRTFNEWFGEDLSPKIPSRLSTAWSTMSCCRIVDTQKGCLIDNADIEWQNAYRKGTSKEFGDQASKTTFKCIKRLVQTFKIEEFLQ